MKKPAVPDIIFRSSLPVRLSDAAARNEGMITRKAVILVFKKREESRSNAAKTPMLIYANTPSTGLQKIIKKSSPDTLLWTRVRVRTILVEMRGVEPLSESTSSGCSPGADGYFGSPKLPVPLTEGKPTRPQVR